jgi:energy-coupling factor transporter ATP-binding protein EcfA2
VKQYPSLRALDGVSLAIEAGESFALLGPNGAGKTTLIGAICGLVRKTSGTVRVFGVDQDVDAVTPRYRLGLVPQEVNFDPFFTARECLRIQPPRRQREPDRLGPPEPLQHLGPREPRRLWKHHVGLRRPGQQHQPPHAARGGDGGWAGQRGGNGGGGRAAGRGGAARVRGERGEGEDGSGGEEERRSGHQSLWE